MYKIMRIKLNVLVRVIFGRDSIRLTEISRIIVIGLISGILSAGTNL